ncbi:hypothetical protein CPB84DRAFT_1823745 [Gymnopilus junonius]|uniref:BTB domain-containing protein n=1 Tax=Gymnopilus junonius TaxID=109634 RepID=A0A9P5NU75_GYMJU|nr:hypothetical protein CPB84DRAFT_1823745 [Gymnopilus junonius]
MMEIDEGARTHEQCAFPGPEFSTGGERLRLTEPASILEVVFQFVYPRRHPTLNELDFESVAAVAEAVEKYKIFSAMKTQFIPEHAEKIFLHGVKHDYTNLIDDAAYHLLSRQTSFRILKQLPPHFIMPWLEYQNAWRHIFENTANNIRRSNMDATSICHEIGYDEELDEYYVDFCRNCIAHTLAWLSDLDAIDSLPELKAAVSKTQPYSKIAVTVDPLLCDVCNDDHHCRGLPPIARLFRKKLDAVPPFTHFLQPKA